MDIYKVEQIENPNNTLTVKPGQFWKNDGGMWCVRLEHTAGLSVRRYLRKWQAEERADKAVERENKIMKNENAKHTPGPREVMVERPWIVKMSEPSEIGPGHKYACVGGGTEEVNNANAILIASAPDMADTIERLEAEKAELLAALEEMVQDSECYCADNVAHKGPCGYCKARAILGNTKGE